MTFLQLPMTVREALVSDCDTEPRMKGLVRVGCGVTSPDKAGGCLDYPRGAGMCHFVTQRWSCPEEESWVGTQHPLPAIRGISCLTKTGRGQTALISSCTDALGGLIDNSSKVQATQASHRVGER